VAIAASVCGAIGLLIACGWMLSPERFGPTRARGVVHWGGWALEASFYLACGVAIVQSFRIMEGFFRHPDARALATLPTRLPALFLFRLTSAMTETLVLAGAATIFLLPVLLKGSAPQFLAAALLQVLAAFLIVAIGFVSQMSAGVANYKSMPAFLGEMDERSGGPGGGSAAYLFSPAIALAVSIFLVLVVKMSLDEVFKSSLSKGELYIPGIMKFTGGVVVVGGIGCLVWSFRLYIAHYPLLFARFFETELHRIDVGFDYFAKDRKPAKGLEARLPTKVRLLYRLHRLQMARRTPLIRLGTTLVPIFALVVFLAAGDRFAAWGVAVTIVGWVWVLSAPWSRLEHPEMEPGMGHLLPVDRSALASAKRWLLLREVCWAAIPISVASLVLPGWELRLAGLLGLGACVLSIPLFEALAATSPKRARMLGVACLCALAPCVRHSLALGLAALVLLGAVSAFLTFRSRKSQ